MPSDLSLRGPDGAVAISGRQLRFRRERPVIRPSTARLPRRFAPRNDTSGGAVVHQCPPAVEFSCTRRSTPVKGHAASVRRQSRQRLRSERRYRRNWCMPLYRYPTRIAGAAPGEACRAPTTRHRCPACFSPSISGHNSPYRRVYMTIRHRGGDGGTWQRNQWTGRMSCGWRTARG